MRKIITTLSQPEVLVDQLEGKEIVAYRCSNSTNNHVAMLSRLHKNESNSRFGFINIGYPTSAPTYTTNTFFDSLRAAQGNRKLFVFDNQAELIEAIYLKTF